MKIKMKILFIFIVFFACKKSFEPVTNIENLTFDIAYISDRDGCNQLYLMKMDGSQDRKITNDINNYYFPQFSFDGTEILLYSGNAGHDDIYIMNTDCSRISNLTNSFHNDNLCQFSPDGSKIAYVSNRDGNREIYIMDKDGSNSLRLTNNNRIDHSPQFSPDGSKILFYTVTLSNHTDLPHTDFYNIYCVDINGENLVRLTPDSTLLIITNFISDYKQSTFDWSPKWSPDGSMITFQSYYRNHGFEVFIMDANGDNLNRLTNTEGNNSAPCFSPDGSTIIFRTGRSTTMDIYSMNLDGTNQVNLTPDSDDTFFYQFSPDGKKIIFTDQNDFTNSGSKYRIYLMDTNGNSRKMITQSSFHYDDLFPCFKPE